MLLYFLLFSYFYYQYMQKGEFFMIKKNHIKWLRVQEQYMQKYYFLGLKNKAWNLLFEKVEEKLDMENFDCQHAKNLLDRYFKRYIDKEIEEGKTRIINNLLILIRKQNAQITYLFSEFFKTIHDLNIEISEEYYIKLKKESVILQRMLAEADLEQVLFQNLESSYQKNALLLIFKPAHVTLSEVKRVYTRYYDLLHEEEKEALLERLEDSSYLAKFKYLIMYDSIFQSIYDTYCEEIEKIDNSSFHRVLLDLSLDELKYIVENHEQYRYMTIEHLKKQEYLYFISHFIKQSKVLDTPSEEAISCQSHARETRNVRWKRNDRKFYDYFVSIKPNLTQKDKRAIDTLFSFLSKERQEGIQQYLQGIYRQYEPIGKQANNDIQKLKYQFRKYLMNGTLINNHHFENFYSYFTSIKPDLTQEDKQAIDTLFGFLSKERQEDIKNYLKGIYLQKTTIGKRANRDIEKLKCRFKRYLVTGQLFSSMRYRSLYSYFTSIKPELTQEDKQVIDTLFNRLPKERQEKIKSYLKGDILTGDPIVKIVYNDIGKLKYYFKKYIMTGKVYGPDCFQDVQKIQNLYSYFISIKPDLNEEDKKMIDFLFSLLPTERQEGIEGYIKRIYHQKDSIGKRAHQDILNLKHQFRNLYTLHLKKFQTLLLEMKEIENRFYQLGYTPEEYQSYKKNWEQEIKRRGIIDIISMIRIFIGESNEMLKQIEERRSL